MWYLVLKFTVSECNEVFRRQQTQLYKGPVGGLRPNNWAMINAMCVVVMMRCTGWNILNEYSVVVKCRTRDLAVLTFRAFLKAVSLLELRPFTQVHTGAFWMLLGWLFITFVFRSSSPCYSMCATLWIFILFTDLLSFSNCVYRPLTNTRRNPDVNGCGVKIQSL